MGSPIGWRPKFSLMRCWVGSLDSRGPKFNCGEVCGFFYTSPREIAFSTSDGNSLQAAELCSTRAKRHCASTASLSKLRADGGVGEDVAGAGKCFASPNKEGDIRGGILAGTVEERRKLSFSPPKTASASRS